MRILIYGVSAVLLSFACAYVVLNTASNVQCSRPCISQVDQVYELFATNAEKIKSSINKTIEQVQGKLDLIRTAGNRSRTFTNTFVPLDEVFQELDMAKSAMYALSMAHPEESVRTAAGDQYLRLVTILIDTFQFDEGVYRALKGYAERLEKEAHELVTTEQTYALEQMLKGFLRNGIQLPKEQRDIVRRLQMELSELHKTFDANIAASERSIVVRAGDLDGLDDAFIGALKKGDNGMYIIPAHHTLVSRVLEQCQVAATREKLYHAFMQKAYPENETVLERMREVSELLALRLGYESYAQYMLEEQMAKHPKRVKDFLALMLKRVQPKAHDEIATLLKELPPSVKLYEGKLQPWDFPFVYQVYKKKHYEVDEAKIAEYFPLDYTLPALLKIYEDFFGVCFTKVRNVHLWHTDIQAYAVYKKGRYLGLIILDMFPRPHKFTHAGFLTVTPTLKEASGRILPGVGILFLNFSPHEPRLLKRSEVCTFFHEFGHALHVLLGATEYASTSSAAVKLDFIEMPSQMLEEWLWNPQILKAISSHIQTKEPLSDELIGKILASRHIAEGDSVLRNICFSKFSLDYFSLVPGSVDELWQQVHGAVRPHSVVDPLNKGYCSFVHLSGYGPSYYGYLWSKVFAVDLFTHIEPHGLRNPEIGSRYRDEVLAPGASKDPEELLRTFLGREPSMDAFFKDLGVA
jgi:thimet oligopeptidase